MPYGGAYTARSPGELRTFSFDLAGDLDRGDTIASVTTTLVAHPAASGDPDAGALLVGWPQRLLGPRGDLTVVAQQIGANPSKPAGFVPSITYAWTISVVAESGDTLVWTVMIPVAAA